jgi:mRNA-degrading endonuclease toxin of MazEF toxin-antitoxin module
MRRAPRRGDVYWVVLDPTTATGIKKTRPSIIVPNDSCNAYVRPRRRASAHQQRVLAFELIESLRRDLALADSLEQMIA